MRRRQSFFLILIALWLPLQAAAAWTMALCSHEKPEVVVGMPCHGHAEEAPVATLDVSNDHECENCGICHLASAGFLLAAVDPGNILLTSSVLVPKQPVASPSHVVPPPQQPPRRLN